MLMKNEQQQLEQLCQQNPELECLIKKMEQEHQFQISQISHEIRNPVTLINSFLQLFAASNPEAATGPYWTEIVENMQFLRILLSELSKYNNAKTLQRQKGNLLTLIQSVLESNAPAMREAKIQVQVYKKTPIPSFNFDAVKLRQVFLNLIRNAQESMPNGGRLSVSLWMQKDMVTIQFQDTGCGIPVEHIPTLFDSFVTHKKDGTGLGLAIAKNVIEAHGGTIQVESEAGQGTTFLLNLPLFFL